MAKGNVLIAVENHGLLRLIQNEIGNQVAGVVEEVASEQDVLLRVNRMKSPLLILEDRLARRFSLDFCRQLRMDHPDLKILVIGATSHELVIWGFLKDGVNGYLLEENIGAEISFAVQTLVKGGIWISPNIAEKMISRALEEEDYLCLTSREIEILKMVSEGKKDVEIARAIGVSERTVRNYVRDVLEKINVNTRLQAVTWAASQGLLP